MKGLDFKSVAPGGQGAAPDSEEDEEEDVSEGESSEGDDDDEEDDEEEEDEDEDESDEEEEEESDEEGVPEPAPKKPEPAPAVKKTKAVEEPKVKVQEVKVDNGSAKVCHLMRNWFSRVVLMSCRTFPRHRSGHRCCRSSLLQRSRWSLSQPSSSRVSVPKPTPFSKTSVRCHVPARHPTLLSSRRSYNPVHTKISSLLWFCWSEKAQFTQSRNSTVYVG